MPKKNFAKSIKKTTTIRNAAIKAICQNIFMKLLGFKFIASIVAPSNLSENLLSFIYVVNSYLV